MKIIPPRILETPMSSTDFSTRSRQALDEESPLTGFYFHEEHAEQLDRPKLEIKQSVFRGCSFLDCNFEGSCLIDVLFEDCNFSNSNFSEAYFERCQWISCKGIGLVLDGAVLKHLSVQRSNLCYACFDKARMNGVRLEETDLTEASLSELDWKNIEAQDVRFIQNNFFKTPLTGIDFTKNELIAPLLSSPPTELRGARITPEQAVALIGLWGVIVK